MKFPSFSSMISSNLESRSLFGIKFSSKFSILSSIFLSEVFISGSSIFSSFISLLSFSSFSSFTSLFFFFFSSCFTPQEKFPFFILIAYSIFLSFFSLCIFSSKISGCLIYSSILFKDTADSIILLIILGSCLIGLCTLLNKESPISIVLMLNLLLRN